MRGAKVRTYIYSNDSASPDPLMQIKKKVGSQCVKPTDGRFPMKTFHNIKTH